LAARRARWEAPKPKADRGILWKYARQVGSACQGAVTHPGKATEATACSVTC
jgi:dihydroxy-acid dehydratase